MKRKTKISMIILLALIVVGLSSCDNVYSSGISGKVVNNSGEGISGVDVYAYTSKEAWNKAYDSYEPGQIFKDDRCQFYNSTGANGTFNITPFVWKTSNSPWGEDYASADVYLILFSKDYGIHKVDRNSIISSSSGNVGEITIGNKITEESTLTIDFVIDGSNTKIDGVTTFDYSYFDGYNDIKGELSAVDGTATLKIKSLKDSSTPTTVTISNIQTNQDVWSVKEDKSEYEITVDSKFTNEKIGMNREYWYFENGISGKVEADKDSTISIGSYSAKVSIKTGTTDFTNFAEVNVIDTTPQGEFVISKSGEYTGLAKGEKIKVENTEDVLTVTVEIIDSSKSDLNGTKIEKKFDTNDNVSKIIMPTIKLDKVD